MIIGDQRFRDFYFLPFSFTDLKLFGSFPIVFRYFFVTFFVFESGCVEHNLYSNKK